MYLYSLILKRCARLDNVALDPLRVGFSNMFYIDLSDNGFVNKQTLRKLLYSGLTSIRLVGWHISPEYEIDITKKNWDICHSLLFTQRVEREY